MQTKGKDHEKKSEKICFFLPNALDKRFSSAILIALTGKTGNNASPEIKTGKGTKMEKEITTIEQVKEAGYKLHKSAWHRGYVSRRCREGIVTPYKGRYGVGYAHHEPSWKSTTYHHISYYVK